MGTTPENQNQNLMTSDSLQGGKVAYGKDDYPALDRTPSGNPVKPTSESDLKPRQSVHDPDHIEVTQHGNMTVAREVGPSLPFRGPLQHGAGMTTSTTAEQMQRQLDNDLKVREADLRGRADPRDVRHHPWHA